MDAKASTWIRRIAALAASVALACMLVACSGGSSAPNAASEDGPEGTYTGLYTKFVGDPDSARVTDEEFSLTLNADGTGTHARDEMEFSVKWKLDGEDFSMTETFMGATIEYVGTLSGDGLDIFNGDPEDDFTCEYVYIKGEPPAEDPMAVFAPNLSAEQTAAMSTTMACGLYAVDNGRIYGSFATGNGTNGLTYRDFTDNDGSLSTSGNTVLQDSCYPNYIGFADGYVYYLRAGSGNYTVNRVLADGGDPEVLCDENCDYLFMFGKRLYFVDGAGKFVSCALDGSDKQVVVDKEVAWPYLIDEKWAIYQDVADGKRLHLTYLPSQFDLAITETAGAAPVIDGSTLWYTEPREDGTSILHKMDLGAFDAESQTFPDEAGTLPVSENVLVGNGFIYLGMFYPNDTVAETLDRWDRLQIGEPDSTGAKTEVFALTPDYLFELDTNADGDARLFGYKTGSSVGFQL